MINKNPKIAAHDGYVVSKSTTFTVFDYQSFNRLYLPILGTDAATVYQALLSQVDAEPLLSNRQAHASLLAVLNIDLDHFQCAKRRLEALGLLRSFYQTDQMGAIYVYQLASPLNFAGFLNDDLLSVLLLNAVGEAMFQKIHQEFVHQTIDTSKMREVTASYFETYHVNSNSLTDLPATIEEARTNFNVSAQETIQIANDFDFNVLSNLLANSYVGQEQLTQNKRLIYTEHQLYGLSEVEMSRYIQQATDPISKELQADQLKVIIAQSRPMVATAPTPNDQKESQSEKVEDLTLKDEQLITVAKQYAPIDFLEQLKQQKGGYVANSEQRVLQSILNRQLFSPAVINILIFYLIEERGFATLNKNMLDAVANSWAQNKVTSAKDAIHQIKNFNHSTTKSTNWSGRKQKIKEELPDWARDDYQGIKATPVDEQEAKKAKQRVEQRRKKWQLGGAADGKAK